MQPDGKILVGGEFSNIGGQTRNSIARLDPLTGAADSFNPSISIVSKIALQPDGKILATSPFVLIGGQTRRLFVRLDPITGLADAFDPNPSQVLQQAYGRAIAVQADGKVLVAGDFLALSPNGGPPVTPHLHRPLGSRWPGRPDTQSQRHRQ